MFLQTFTPKLAIFADSVRIIYRTNSKNEMNEINQKLVASMVKLYENQGLSHDELIEAGNKGLQKAEEHYKPNSRFRFIAYAVWWIRQSIMEAIERRIKEYKYY